MRIRRLVLSGASLSLAIGALLVGCNKGDVPAQADWTINVTANPANMVLGNDNQGTSTITATVYDKSGYPKKDVGVRFSTSAGNMESGGGLILTDSSGAARDILHAGKDATVTVASGSVTKTVAVGVGGKNTAPVAAVTITPSGSGHVAQPVTFSGAASSDAEDGVVSWYHWVIVSNNPDPDVSYDESTTNQAIVRTFRNAQHLDVVLTVGDHLGSTGTASEMYDIVLNQNPTAKINGTSTGIMTQDTSNGSWNCAVSLSGCSSTDPDGQIVSWEWNWGDRTDPPVPFCNNQHTYTNLYATTSFTVSLVVYDNGDGTCGPRGTGPDPCTSRGVSTPATTLVTCTVPSTP